MSIFQVGTLSIFQIVRLVVIIFLARIFYTFIFGRWYVQGSISTLDIALAVCSFSLIVVIPILTVLNSAFQHWYRDAVISQTSPQERIPHPELIPVILNSSLMCLLNFKIFIVAFLISGIGAVVLRLRQTLLGKTATCLIFPLRSLTWAKRFLRLSAYTLWVIPLLHIMVHLFIRQAMGVSEIIILWNLNLLILPPLCRFALK